MWQKLIKLFIYYRGLLANWILKHLISYTSKVRNDNLTEAFVENNHLHIKFLYQKREYSLILPYDRRSRSASTYHLVDSETSRVIQHLPGIKFQTSASQLGIDKIVRINNLGQEQEFEGDIIPN